MIVFEGRIKVSINACSSSCAKVGIIKKQNMLAKLKICDGSGMITSCKLSMQFLSGPFDTAVLLMISKSQMILVTKSFMPIKGPVPIKMFF